MSVEIEIAKVIQEWRHPAKPAVHTWEELSKLLTAEVLKVELLPGITLRRVVELRDRLVVLEDDQSLPRLFGDDFVSAFYAETRKMVGQELNVAGFRRVSPLGEKEG
jgi:hypothetical protein